LSRVDIYLKGFVLYSKTAIGSVDYEKEISTAKDFESLATKSSFKTIENDELHYLIKRYFSIPRNIGNRFFLKKDYYIRELLKTTPIATFKSELLLLLYGKEELRIRWDRFMAKVKRMDSYNTSILLSYTFPDRYSLWPYKLFHILDKLKIFSSIETDNLKRKYNKASGKDYSRILDFMGSLKNYLQRCNLGKVDYLRTITFIYYLNSKK